VYFIFLPSAIILFTSFVNSSALARPFYVALLTFAPTNSSASTLEFIHRKAFASPSGTTIYKL